MTKLMTASSAQAKLITLLCAGQDLQISVDSISHISKFGSRVVVYTDSGNFVTSYRMKQVYDALPSHLFCRIHSSHIIALHHLRKIEAAEVFINSFILPITSYYKEQMNKKFQVILNHCYNFFEG